MRVVSNGRFWCVFQRVSALVIGYIANEELFSKITLRRLSSCRSISTSSVARREIPLPAFRRCLFLSRRERPITEENYMADVERMHMNRLTGASSTISNTLSIWMVNKRLPTLHYILEHREELL